MGINRKWSGAHVGVWVSTESGLELVWGLCGGVGVSRKWSGISLGVTWGVWVSTGSGLGLVWVMWGVGVNLKWSEISLGVMWGCGYRPEVVSN